MPNSADRPEYELKKDTERTGMPRWLRLTLIIAAIVIVVVVVMMVIGGHGGGPARHMGGTVVPLIASGTA